MLNVIDRAMFTGLAVATLLLSGNAFADIVEIKASATKFEPAVVFVKPGDSVKFTGMSGHQTGSIDGMIPEGAQAWKSTMGEELTVKLNKDGIYVYECSPHMSRGMVGAIVVGEGEAKNLEAIRKHPENNGTIGRVIGQLETELEARRGRSQAHTAGQSSGGAAVVAE